MIHFAMRIVTDAAAARGCPSIELIIHYMYHIAGQFVELLSKMASPLRQEDFCALDVAF